MNPNIQKGSTNALKDEEEDKEKNNSRINAFEHNRQNKIIQKENKNANIINYYNPIGIINFILILWLKNFFPSIKYISIIFFNIIY